MVKYFYGDDMNNKFFVSCISFICCVLLFFMEISFLLLFSVRNGIKKDSVVNIINDIPVINILKNFDAYNDLSSFNSDLVFDVIESDEMNYFVKENLKVSYLNVFYGEDISYLSGTDVLNFAVERAFSYYDSDDSSSIVFFDTIERLINEFEENVCDNQNNNYFVVINTIFSSTTMNIFMILSVILVIFIILFNMSYDSLIWIGIPTFLSGIMILILTLLLCGTIDGVFLNANIIYYVTKFFGNLIIKMRFVSILFVSIGCCLIIVYYFIKKGYVGVYDGKK